jgi:hypothetical protein
VSAHLVDGVAHCEGDASAIYEHRLAVRRDRSTGQCATSSSNRSGCTLQQKTASHGEVGVWTCAAEALSPPLQ